MNERIRELWNETVKFSEANPGQQHELEKFAELLIKDCIEAIQNKSMNSDDDWEYGLRIAEGAIQTHFGVEE